MMNTSHCIIRQAAKYLPTANPHVMRPRAFLQHQQQPQQRCIMYYQQHQAYHTPLMHYNRRNFYTTTTTLRAETLKPKKVQPFQVTDETTFKLKTKHDYTAPRPRDKFTLARDYSVKAFFLYCFADLLYFHFIFPEEWAFGDKFLTVNVEEEKKKLEQEIATLQVQVDETQRKFYEDPTSKFYLISYDPKERQLALEQWKELLGFGGKQQQEDGNNIADENNTTSDRTDVGVSQEVAQSNV